MCVSCIIHRPLRAVTFRHPTDISNLKKGRTPTRSVPRSLPASGGVARAGWEMSVAQQLVVLHHRPAWRTRSVLCAARFGKNHLQFFEPGKFQPRGVNVLHRIAHEGRQGRAFGRGGITGIKQAHDAVEEGPSNVPCDVAMEDVREPGLALRGSRDRHGLQEIDDQEAPVGYERCRNSYSDKFRTKLTKPRGTDLPCACSWG